MKRLARILYTINSATCIFIGLLHTYVHFQDLETSQLREMMNQEVVVSGMVTNVFKLWQGMSLMMGILLIIVGISHLFILNQLPHSAYPPIKGSLILIFMLLFVIYAGYNYFGGWQVYGGRIGLVLQIICLAISLKKPS